MGYDERDYQFVFEGFNAEIIKGRTLKSGDFDKVVVGYLYQLDNKIFKKGLNLGDNIEINDQTFEIAGFVSEIGNPSDDGNIYLTEESFELLYPEQIDKYGFVMLSSEKSQDPAELADKIEEKLRKRWNENEGEETFSVETFADLIETFASFINIINGILVLIALVSVIVASVNIMNTMYTAVLERTKEIGIMKAIGARNENILFIFVFESGFLGIVGGALGIFFGYLIASAGGVAATASGYSTLQPIFPMSLIIGCLIFSFLIGAISGFTPALQASKLKPVDALRYE